MKYRLSYTIVFIFTIVLGLTSRKIAGIPLITGDILYASMIYWMIRAVSPNKRLIVAILSSLLFCFSIEFMQLIQTPILIWARNHSFFKLILGQGFLWSDLIAYATGTAIAYLIDVLLLYKRSKHMT